MYLLLNNIFLTRESWEDIQLPSYCWSLLLLGSSVYNHIVRFVMLRAYEYCKVHKHLVMWMWLCCCYVCICHNYCPRPSTHTYESLYSSRYLCIRAFRPCKYLSKFLLHELQMTTGTYSLWIIECMYMSIMAIRIKCAKIFLPEYQLIIPSCISMKLLKAIPLYKQNCHFINFFGYYNCVTILPTLI